MIEHQDAVVDTPQEEEDITWGSQGQEAASSESDEILDRDCTEPPNNSFS